MTDVKTGDRVAGVIGQLEQRENHGHRERVGQRIAPFFAGCEIVPRPEQVHDLGDGLVFSHEDSHRAAGIILGQPGNFRGGTFERHPGLFLSLLGQRSDQQTHMARVVGPVGRVGLKPSLPTLNNLPKVTGRRIARQTRKDLIDRIHHHWAASVAFVEWLDRDARELGAERLEDLSFAAAPTVDGLLHIADTEERLVPVARGDLLSDRPKDMPLLTRGVLKLVEQQMLDLGIKAEGRRR